LRKQLFVSTVRNWSNSRATTTKAILLTETILMGSKRVEEILTGAMERSGCDLKLPPKDAAGYEAHMWGLVRRIVFTCFEEAWQRQLSPLPFPVKLAVENDQVRLYLRQASGEWKEETGESTRRGFGSYSKEQILQALPGLNEAQKQELYRLLAWKCIGEPVASWNRGPLLWLTQHTKTEDQHWMAKGTAPVAPSQAGILPHRGRAHVDRSGSLYLEEPGVDDFVVSVWLCHVDVSLESADDVVDADPEGTESPRTGELLSHFVESAR
jgi:hypothetical protein